VANGNGALVGREKGLVGPAAGGVQVGKGEYVAVKPLKGVREKGAPRIELAGQFTYDMHGRATVTIRGFCLSGCGCD
jgi:hypothetical protein